ncbi:uncharacterized protein LOC143482125 isoform X2 [Brachyhypopomus gauderio]|uniref:uncharacterized protein LOC143482125 isoform X2 n=1 Tax=Brachyhypopomus gauderio TaxID=698409 RepID=UPI0040417310
MFRESFRLRQQHPEVSKRRASRCTSRVTSTITKIVFEDSSPVQLIEAECSCVAGIALCNHNVALLYQTAHYSQLNLAAVPPVLSCTETEQCWHKPRIMGLKPGRVSDMVVMSTKPKQRTVANGVRSTLYKAVRGELPDPDVLKVDEAYKDFPADIAPLITTMAISADVPLVDSAFGQVQEGSPISYQHPVPECVERHNQALSACTAELQDLRRQLSDTRKPVSMATEDTPLETAQLRAALGENDAVINEKVDDVQSEAAEGRDAHSQDKLKGEETETDEEGERGAESTIAYLILTWMLRAALASLN